MNVKGEERRLGTLRARAEIALAGRMFKRHSRDATRHELEVHQVELEMQNEELARAQLENDAARERLRDLYDFAPVAYLTLDPNGAVVEANLLASTLLGMERATLVGKRLYSFVDRNDRHKLKRQLEKPGDGGLAQKVRLRLDLPGGESRTVRCESLAHGPREIRVVLIDVTREEEARLAEEQANRRFRSVFETSGGGMAVIDRQGRFVEASETCSRLLGYTPDELHGKTVLEITHPADRSRVANHIRTGSQGPGPSLSFETRYLKKDGSALWAQVSVSWIFDADSELLYSVALVQDVTERRALEAVLRQAQKLEAMGTLAAGVAHDFNNVLMGVDGLVSVALAKLPADIPGRTYLEDVKGSVRTGAAITRQLLTFCRTHKAEPIVFELNPLLLGQKNMLERLLGADITIALRLEAEDCRVRLDPRHVEQILMNLAINARDAMPKGGSIVIETRAVERDQQSFVVLSFTDTGCGMNEEVRARVFEPFFTTKPSGQGTGLGLSTVYGIVKQAGGEIELRSREGEGTAVNIFLPWTDEPITLDEVQSSSLAPGVKATILLVEDDRSVRQTLEYCLTQAGHRVLSAKDGASALELSQTHSGSIDLLLTDMVLPGMSGPEVCSEARKGRPGLQVLYMSAHDSAWLIETGRLPSGTHSLEKPFDEATLLCRISESLQ